MPSHQIFYDVLGILGLVASLAGALVSVLHVSRSLWAGALLFGFGCEILTGVFQRVLTYAVSHGTAFSDLAWAYLLSSSVGLLGHVLVVIGVVGVLSSLPARRDPRQPMAP
jgi:hypothetical protein